MTLTPEQQLQLDTALAVLATVAPALGPNGAMLSSILTVGMAAIHNANANGVDVTDEALDAIFAQFDINAADDLKAQAEEPKA